MNRRHEQVHTGQEKRRENFRNDTGPSPKEDISIANWLRTKLSFFQSREDIVCSAGMQPPVHTSALLLNFCNKKQVSADSEKFNTDNVLLLYHKAL